MDDCRATVSRCGIWGGEQAESGAVAKSINNWSGWKLIETGKEKKRRKEKGEERKRGRGERIGIGKVGSREEEREVEVEVEEKSGREGGEGEGNNRIRNTECLGGKGRSGAGRVD